MTGLREEMDRTLRAVSFSEAPVEQAKRDGRRIRTRRRVMLLAGAFAVVAVAAGYPALTRSGAAAPPAPAVGKTPAPHQPPYGGDPIVTGGPAVGTTEAPGGLADTTGVISQGTAGGVRWQVTVDGPGAANPVPADSCYAVTLSAAGNLGDSSCTDLPAFMTTQLTDNPAAFTAMSEDGMSVTIGEVASDVTYFIVTFTDGQQLKLLPVTTHGHRYVAWVAPLSATIASVVAHLGGPYFDSGQKATTVPFDLPGQLATFGLWQLPGQAAPPRATRVIGGGIARGKAWSATAYEGPWGTCFATGPGSPYCVPLSRLGGTGVLGGWGGNPPGPAFGSAAPGVASVTVALSDGTAVNVQPVTVGNERLFAFAIAKGVSPKSWAAYDASGKKVGAGSVKPG